MIESGLTLKHRTIGRHRGHRETNMHMDTSEYTHADGRKK